ncbi:hypothetical protein L596_006364 [Steinernema carpocapsae]|uniref:DNA damage-binding protein 1 n=1 Tax=Steinernema carpocapsae TaxID=34508 RepID=A0A4U8V3Z2_STECR|nr:hypothetical protein L596_006364 [Steinernema carpocapsae]
MACSYVVSAQKPTLVTHSVVGNFRSSTKVELVAARINRLELLEATPSGLKSIYEFPIYGRIEYLSSYRKAGENLDSLIVLTSKMDLAILKFNDEGKLVPVCYGNIIDRVGRQSETGLLVTCHAFRGTLGVRQSDGHLKLVFWDASTEFRAFNIRMNDLKIVDIQFIINMEDPPDTYNLAVIYDENGHHLKVLRIDFDHADINAKIVWKIENADANTIIPVKSPVGGFISVGTDKIIYHKDETTFVAADCPPQHGSFCSFARLPDRPEQFLLGDFDGVLYMINLTTIDVNNVMVVTHIQLDRLGDITQPECMSYIDNGVMFVGSRFGDSQLLRLGPEKDASGSFMQLIESYPNLGPIQDMLLVKSEAQTQVLTCSGAFHNGSLRIVRSGIGIDKLVTIDIERVSGVFPLAMDPNSPYHTHIVLSHFTESRFLKIEGQEIEDVTATMSMYATNAQTLWIGKMPGEVWVQVTERQILAIKDGRAIAEPFDNQISCVSVNQDAGQLMVALSKTACYVKFEENGEIKRVFEHAFDDEIACLDISPFEENQATTVFALGFWKTKEIRLYTLEPQPQEITRCELGERDIFRTILMIRMESTPYVLVSLADGSIHYFIADFEHGSLVEHKKATLGTLPIKLVKFYSHGHATVFACGDRPTVLFSSSRKLVFSSVNLKLVETMCCLHTSEFPETFIFISHEDMTIGNVDEIQKLHIRTIKVGETVRRMASQPQSQSVALLTIRVERRTGPGGGLEHPRCYSNSCSSVSDSEHPSVASIDQDVLLAEIISINTVCFLDADTLEPFHVHELGPCEQVQCLKSITFGPRKKTFYAVGTAMAHPHNAEVTAGRILLFECGVYRSPKRKGERYVKLAHQRSVKGAVYDMALIEEHNRLIAAINSTCRVFELTDHGDLQLTCSFYKFLNCIGIKIQGSKIIGTDLVRSLIVLEYRHEETKLVELARDYDTQWMTTSEFLDNYNFICADNDYNLLTLCHDPSVREEHRKRRLITTGRFYVGEQVNCFRIGELINAPLDSSVNTKNPMLFGTVEGGIGVVVQLEPSIFEYLVKIENKLGKYVQNCMRVTHQKYREFYTESQKQAHSGFIDGVLMEGLLDMPRDEVAELMKGVYMKGPKSTFADIELSVEELLKIIEDLSRMH